MREDIAKALNNRWKKIMKGFGIADKRESRSLFEEDKEVVM